MPQNQQRWETPFQIPTLSLISCFMARESCPMKANSQPLPSSALETDKKNYKLYLNEYSTTLNSANTFKGTT